MTVKTCPDCGAPVREDMWPTNKHGCWFSDQYVERMRRQGRDEQDIEAFKMSGGDPPCAGNKYDYDHREDVKVYAWRWGMVLVAAAVAIAVFWVLR